MKTLAIDLGKSYGWCFLDDAGKESGHGKYVDLVDWGDQFSKLLNKWKPDIVVLSQTNSFGFFNALRAALLSAGVAFYVCGKKGIPGVEFPDNSARKQVFGKAIKKKEVQQLRPGLQADELDAIILAEGWAKISKE